MILSSKPKPVYFRIVLNNAEITSMESLQKFFDFEMFIVKDQMQLIRWLKCDDKKKGEDKGDQIEAIVKGSVCDVINDVAFPRFMSIIYERSFDNTVQFVDFLYGLNENYYIAKSNFSLFISQHSDQLHSLFPIESIPQGNNNLDSFFKDLQSYTETSSYLSQLYYSQGKLDLSQSSDPHLWELKNSERSTIKDITSGRYVIPSDNLSIIGAEFIFLCTVAYLTINQKPGIINSLSNHVDQAPEFKPLRDHIGGSLKKLISKRKLDCYQICERLGYTTPHEMDPLFNEKLFLSSFFAKDRRNELLSVIKRKNDYFPALFVLDSNRYESRVLQSQLKVQYTWFSHILNYYDNPMGLNGDSDLHNIEVSEMSIITHQFIESPSIMKEHFCRPDELDPNQGVQYLRKHIQQIKQSFQLMQPDSCDLEPLPLEKREKEYYNFFKEVIYVSNHWNEYIDPLKGKFTHKAEKLIAEYRNKKSALYKERLFVVTILFLIKDNGSNIYLAISTDKSRIELNDEIKQLSQLYTPLKALFKNQISLLSENDKKILNLTGLTTCLNADWTCECPDMGRFSFRQEHYDKFLTRWIANFVYYI